MICNALLTGKQVNTKEKKHEYLTIIVTMFVISACYLNLGYNISIGGSKF